MIEGMTGVFTGSFMRHRWSSNDESKYTKTINPFKESFIFKFGVTSNVVMYALLSYFFL